MAPYTLVFCSSADISLPLLEALYKHEAFHIEGVICQPDRPAGRGGALKPPAPKLLAQKWNIPVYQPENLNQDDELFADLSADPPDILLSFAYGQILSQKYLDLAKRYPLNVHASLLPLYRGASPIQEALLNGDAKTGLTLMKMVKKMDAGPIAGQIDFSVDGQCAGQVHDGLAELAADFIPGEIQRILNEASPFAEQNHEQATYCTKLSREQGYIDFTQSAERIMRKYRAYTPWPGVWTRYKGKRLKFLELEISKDTHPEGQVVCASDGVFVGTADGSVELKRVQVEGKQAMSADDFLKGQAEFCETVLPS